MPKQSLDITAKHVKSIAVKHNMHEIQVQEHRCKQTVVLTVMDILVNLGPVVEKFRARPQREGCLIDKDQDNRCEQRIRDTRHSDRKTYRYTRRLGRELRRLLHTTNLDS